MITMTDTDTQDDLDAMDMRTGSFEELRKDLTIIEAKHIPAYPSMGGHITECEGCWELTPHVDNNGLCPVCGSGNQLRAYVEGWS